MLTSPARLCRPCRLAGPAHAAATAGLAYRKEKSGERRTVCWRGLDSNLYGAFPVKWFFSVYHQFFVRSGKRVLRPVACDQVPGARGRGQGTETLAKLGGLPPRERLNKGLAHGEM